MKRLLSIVALLGLTGLGINLSAQDKPSAQDPSASQPQQQVNTQSQSQSAQAFQGQIAKSGNDLVLKDDATQASYKLDNQDKAKQFEGQKVKVMATMDPSTNTLHVVDITPAESK